MIHEATGKVVESELRITEAVNAEWERYTKDLDNVSVCTGCLPASSSPLRASPLLHARHRRTYSPLAMSTHPTPCAGTRDER